MLLTLIVPIYNAENYILKTLKSIFQQPLKSVEVILVNDGSTDTSIKIINKFIKDHNTLTKTIKD